MGCRNAPICPYRVPLPREDSEGFRQRQARAAQLAREIEGSAQYRLRVAMENDDEERRSGRHPIITPTAPIGPRWKPLAPIEIHWDPLGPIGIHWTPLGPIGIHWGSLDSIGARWDPLGPIEIYWDTLGSIGIHWDPLGPIGIH